jgi:glutathione S-transferase
MHMLDLYHFRNSVCAQKVRMTLHEKGLDWNSFEVNLFTQEQYDPEYLKLNPKGYVPTLIHNGRAIRESTLICEYINDAFPSPPLVPADPADKAQMRLWSKTVDEGLFEGVVVLSFSAMFRDRMKQQTEEEREIRYLNVGDPTRRDRFKSAFVEGVDSPYVLRGIAAYEIAFDSMEKTLSGGAEWLSGDMFSLAEINLAPMVARLHYLALLDIWIADRPAVTGWWRRVQDRASYRAELSEALSSDEIEEMQVTGAVLKPRITAIREEYFEQFGK